MDNIGYKKSSKKRKVSIDEVGKTVKQEQFRVVLKKDANMAAENFVESLNKEFIGGKTSKSEITNYVLLNLNRLLSDADIKVIQNNCFNEKEVLHSLSKSEDDLPESVKIAIREVYGLLDKTKKRLTKQTQDLSTAQVVDIGTAD